MKPHFNTKISIILTLLFPALSIAQIINANGHIISEPQDDTTLHIEQQNNKILQQINDKDEATPPNISQESDQPVVVNEETLLAHPELLERAMQSVVRQQNITGINKILPIYIKLPQHSGILANYAQGLVDLSQQNFAHAITSFKKVLTHQANAPMAQLNLAIAYFYDKQYQEAQGKLSQLNQQANLPNHIQNIVSQYLLEIRKRKDIEFSGSASVTYDPNVNNAPNTRVIQSPNGSLTFEAKQPAYGVNYQANLGKSLILPHGINITPNLNLWGKNYLHHSQYNDSLVRTNLNFSLNRYRYNISIEPYFSKRFYGNHPYSHSIGLTLNGYRRWNNFFSTSLSLGHSKETYDRKNHQFYNNHENEANLNLIFQPANRSALFILGTDIINHYATRDREDSYRLNRYRFMVRKQFANGLNARVSVSNSQRHYHGANWFTNGANRIDKETTFNIALQHQQIQKWGIMPRLVWESQKVRSNSILNTYTKQSLFMELTRSF